jgi:hypothetical protein
LGLFIGLGCYTLAWIVAEIATGVIFYSYGKFTVKIPSRDA